jgi:DNA end-binding protein Ku
MPTRSIDTANLSFGLVVIPVKIYSTGEPSHEIHFHFVHKGCGERLHQQYVCPAHGVLERDEIAKGYELTKGTFIELSKSELKALEAVASDEIAIHEFVPAAAIDPLFIEHSYYLGPGASANRAYQLFRDALAHADLVAVAAYSARGKQYIVELRPYQTGLAMHQLRYPDEIRPWSEVPAVAHVKTSPAELALARQVIDNLRHETFDPSRYKDEVKARVRALIATKAKGGEITAPPTAKRAPVIDLMAALKASLGADRPSKHNGSRTHASRIHTSRTKTRTKTAAKRPAHATHARRGTSERTRATAGSYPSRRSKATVHPARARRSNR